MSRRVKSRSAPSARSMSVATRPAYPALSYVGDSPESSRFVVNSLTRSDGSETVGALGGIEVGKELEWRVVPAASGVEPGGGSSPPRPRLQLCFSYRSPPRR